MNLAVAATVFAIVFPAELPDKTALASLVLGTRYRPSGVFVGVALAFAVHAALAVTAGSLLVLLPRRVLQAVVGVVFLIGAALMFRSRDRGGDNVRLPKSEHPTFVRTAAISFVVIMIAEFGDLTQIVTANLAARYRDPVAVATGSVLALWAVAALAIVGGRGLLRVMPIKVIARLAAVAMAVLGVIGVVVAVRG